MKKKLLIVVGWLLVFIMFLIIFLFSNMNSLDSNSKSKGIIKESIEFISSAVNIDISSNDIEDLVNKYNYPFRKLCHFSEYFILSLLLLNAFYISGIRDKRLFIFTLIICLLCSISDEFHQSFIDGRSSLFTDSLIDFTGSVFSCIIYYLFLKNKTIK